MRAPDPPPPIPAYRESAERPRWSVVIPTYECAELLEPCLHSVLEAEPGSDAEIVVVDDRSQDRPEAVVDRIGDERLRFVRNPENLGAIGNFNSCLREAAGHLVHLLHGDDMVESGFYRAADRAFDDNPAVGMFTGRVTYVDDAGQPAETTRSERSPSGVWDAALDVLTVSNRIRPPSVAVRREMYERLGGFRPDFPHAADWEMWVRLAADTAVWYEDEVVARYRRHGSSDTAGRVLSGANLDERMACIEYLMRYVAPGDRRGRARRAHAYTSLFAGRTAVSLVRAGQYRGAGNQLAGAVRALARAAWASGSGPNVDSQ